MPLPLPIEFFDPDSEPLDPGNVVEITDHDAQGLARLIPEYQDTPRWQAWISSMMASIQEVEAASFDVWEAVLNIDLAVGSQLDILGLIVREDRDALGDDFYRRALSVRVLINRSNGTIEELIAIVRLYEEPEVNGYIRVRENATATQGAHIEVRIVATPLNDHSDILKRLRQAKAAGVGLNLLVAPTPNTSPLTRSFRLSRASAAPEKNTTEGLDRVSPNGGVGGYALHVVS